MVINKQSTWLDPEGFEGMALTYFHLVPHICVSESVQHWFRWWLAAYSQKCIWKYRLRNGGHFVQGEMSQTWGPLNVILECRLHATDQIADACHDENNPFSYIIFHAICFDSCFVYTIFPSGRQGRWKVLLILRGQWFIFLRQASRIKR